MPSTARKAKSGTKQPGEAARLTPLEYEVAIWVGRGARGTEIAARLDLPVATAQALIQSAATHQGCRNVAELEELFQPDWGRIDAPPDSRWERIGGRWVLRDREGTEKVNAENRRIAREAYAERRLKNWKRLLAK